jgi:hypothetical protein
MLGGKNCSKRVSFVVAFYIDDNPLVNAHLNRPFLDDIYDKFRGHLYGPTFLLYPRNYTSTS